MDKVRQTPCKPRIHAVLDKMLNLKAKLNAIEINDLRAIAFCPTDSYEAYSYKLLQQGITPPKIGLRERIIHLNFFDKAPSLT